MVKEGTKVRGPIGGLSPFPSFPLLESALRLLLRTPAPRTFLDDEDDDDDEEEEDDDDEEDAIRQLRKARADDDDDDEADNEE